MALVGGVLGGTLFGGSVLSAAASVQDVLEQNLDASGFIRVHEQGTAHVAVTNFPASQNVTVTNLPSTQNVVLTGHEPFAAGVNATMILPGGRNPFVLFIDAERNGTTFRYRLTPKPLAVNGYFSVEQAVTINADAGTAVRVVASRFPQTAGDGSFVYAVSGHLE